MDSLITKSSNNSISIQIISDVVCPWCIIGYKKLQLAMASFGEDVAFDVTWHPYELDRSKERGDENATEHLMQKYRLTKEQVLSSFANITQIGKELGFTFDFNEASKKHNTFDTHQLLFWAKDSGKQTSLKLALFEAYFTRNENISDVDVLLSCVKEAGLDTIQAKEVLEKQMYANAVRSKEVELQNLGISSVPTIRFSDGEMISGAQSPEFYKAKISSLLG